MTLVPFGELRILAPPGVYTPRSDTALLASQVHDVGGASVLELCAGSGALALTAAHRGAARVVAVDRSARAVLAIRANARLNALQVDARRGNLLEALRDDERFDLILANPPYLPVADGQARRDDRWDAGPDGRDVLDRIIRGATRHLAPDGRLSIVQSDLADIDMTVRMLADHGLAVTHRLEHRGPLGPIAAARRDHLTSCGALTAGATDEVLAVITAQCTEEAQPVAA
ncbi:MAG: methyltransferase [Solirubrobacterales bacterium]|nr:methyltransferase [Solirubrobacterales bacterium]